MNISRKTRRPRKSLPSLPSLSITLPWILAIVIFSSPLLFLKSPYLKIHHINCQYLESQPCPESIIAELDKLSGKDILFITTDNIRQKLLAANPQAQNIDISVDLPDTISVIFHPQSPLARLKTATNSATLIISKSQVVIDNQPNSHSQLPSIIYPKASTLRLGDQIEDEVLIFGLSLMTSLLESYINPSQIIIYSDKLILVELDDNKKAIFTTHYPLTRQVTSLQLILPKATITTDLPIIDVRFKQPVLRPSR